MDLNENSSADRAWRRLLDAASAAPAFAGEPEPPFGFVTSTLARLRAGYAERQELEKLGRWAVLASLSALACLVLLSVGLHLQDRNELDPGLRSLVQVENFQIY